MLIHHVKGYPDSSMYGKNKGVSLLTLIVYLQLSLILYNSPQ